MRTIIFGILCLACGGEQGATQAHSLNGLKVSVPESWTLSPPEQTARLEAAGARRDPGAEVQVLGLSVVPSPAPSLSLMTIVHSSDYSKSMGSVRSAVAEMEGAIREGAQSRGAPFTFDASCMETHCDVMFRIGPTGARQRFWRAGGQMHSSGYTCAGDAGCSVLPTATLPTVPAGAESVDGS